MGKSAVAGKWIKSVIFRKKSSKFKVSKKAAVKDAITISKGSSPDLPLSPSVISDPTSPASDRNGTEGTLGFDLSDPAEVIRQEQAATKVQASFRRFLACRSFRVLKGIIRLQALIRGHLVRRQGVATLHSIRGIVKLQALIRQRRVSGSDTGHAELTKCSPGRFLDATQANPFGLDTVIRPEKIFTNAFIRKLLASLPTAMPLNFHYDLVEPNSAWMWLERWSSFLFHEPVPQKNQVFYSSSTTKQSSNHSRPREGRQKRGVWRVPTINAENNSWHPMSEFGKPKKNMRKSLSLQTEVEQENPPSEIERVRKNLRKISASNPGSTDGSEAMTAKPKLSLRNVARPPASDVLVKVADNTKEKTSDCMVAVAKDFEELGVESSPKPSGMKETVNVQNENQPAIHLYSLENSSADNIPMMEKELNSKEEESIKDNRRTRRRRKPTAKQEYPENVSQNTPTIPSYMGATESAKAKLRAQGSPRLVQDDVENGLSRRHSLPASNGGKLSSGSPQMQRLVDENSKGRSTVDRSLLSSRDVSEKASLPAWRR